MTTELDKLLPVLDMSKEEQESKLRNYAYNHREEGCWHNYMNGHISLADLAFRLRDEVKGSEGHEAFNIGQRVVSDYIFSLPENRPTYEWSVRNARYEKDYKSFFSDEAKPIHWVIACLIAKEKAND